MKKRMFTKKFVSTILLLSMFLNIGSFASVFAEDKTIRFNLPISESGELVMPEKEAVETISKEALEKMMQTTTDFSVLSEEAQKQISDEYRVNEDVMLVCAEAGYSVNESIELAKIFQNVDITPIQFEEMVENFGDREKALQQAKKFANYRYAHPSWKMTEETACINLLVSGISADDILKAKGMAMLLGTDIGKSNSFYSKKISYEEGTLGSYAAMFNTQKAALDQYIKQNNITEEELIAEIGEKLGRVLRETGEIPETRAAEEIYSHPYQNFPMAPYLYEKDGTEVISDQTGSVGYQKTEAILPGKNGLNLEIGIRYNSDDSSAFHIYSKYSGVNVGSLKNQVQQKEMPSPLTIISPGWDFTFSYIQYYANYFDDIYSTLLSSDGSARGIKYSDVIDEEKEEIRLYNAKATLYDVRLYKDSSYTDNEVTSMFCAKYKDGKKEYFDAQGKIMKTENRFGNKILYRYYKNGNEVDHLDQHYNKVEITDTLGQLTTIEKGPQQTEYDDEGNELHIQMMTITLPDQATVTYRLRGSHHPNTAFETDLTQVLESRTDQEGMTTTFEYIEDDYSKFSFIDGWDDKCEYQAYYPLVAINHPTGLRTEYTYENAEGTLCNTSDMWDRYRIVKRADKIGETEHNVVTYSYVYDFSYWGTEVTTRKTNADGLTTESVYTKCESNSPDRARYKTRERVYYMDGANQIDVSKTIYADYFERTHPKTITNYLYKPDGTQSIVTIEKYEYNEYGDPIKYWDAQAEGNTDDIEHLTTYAYDTEYHYLTERSYKTDASTTMKEVFVPTSTHKQIEHEYTYMNNQLIRHTEYYYSSNSIYPMMESYYEGTASNRSLCYSNMYEDDTFLTIKSIGAGIIYNYTYDIYGNVLTEKDGNGNVTTYTYDKLGRQTSVKYPDGTTEATEYQLKDASGNIINRVTTTARNGAKKEYNCDLFGRVETIVDKTENIHEKTYFYDNKGRLFQEADALDNQILYEYDRFGRTTAVKKYDDLANLCDQETYSYQDVYDASTSKTTAVYGIGTNITKNAVYTNKYGNKVREDLGDTGLLSESKRYEYNYVGEPVREIFRTEETGEDEVLSSTVITAQDGVGTTTTVTDYYGNQTRSIKNMLGEEVEVIDGNGNHIYYSYDAVSRMRTKSVPIAGDLSVTTYTYDRNNNIVEENITNGMPGGTDSDRSVYYAYDTMNRLVREWTDEEGETRYTYDNMGNMLTMTTGITEENTAGKTTTYQYDSRNRLIKITDPMGYQEDYEYNDLDQLTMTIDKSGTMIQKYYDAAGRLIRSKTGLENTYHTYYTGNLPQSISRGNETTTYTYNTKGQVTREEVSGTDSIIKTYLYNNRGDITRKQVQRNNGEIYDQTFGYNPMGQMTATGDFMGGGILARYTYDGVGNISTVTWRNDIVTTYTYNTANAISSVKHKLGENVVSEYEYTYYLDGNRAKEIDNVDYGTEYSYDGAGRLEEENRIQRFVLEDDTLEIPFQRTNYTYDAYGNRATMERTQGNYLLETTYTYDANNRLTMDVTVEGDESEATTYTYNSNGNLLSKTVLGSSGMTTTNYTYDFYNRLTGVSQGQNMSASYTYDAFNRRTQKTVNGTATNYVWDGDSLIYEVDGDDNEQRYQYANGLIGMDNGDNLYTYLKNAHGDIVQMTDNTGAIAEDYTYDAWGNQESATHTVANPFRYSGEYFDEETGLIYLRNRYYDSGIGRFITEDPVKDGLNWYVYCENNPVMMVDPLGLDPYDPFNSPDEAAADFGMYIGQKSIDIGEEYAACIYEELDSEGNIYYYYDEPRNDLDTHEKRAISFSIKPQGEIYAVTHTHGAYDANTGNTKDDFSSPDNVASGDSSMSDTGNSDRIGKDYYVVTPVGNLKKYTANSGNVEGTHIRSDMIVDSRIEIHQKMQNTLLWGLLQRNFSNGKAQDFVNAKRDHPNDLSSVVKSLERFR